jgi:hypothetical protein
LEQSLCNFENLNSKITFFIFLRLQNLFLRNCNINDQEADLIGWMIGNMKYQNNKLLNLNLSNNAITDDGAIALSKVVFFFLKFI